MQAVTFLGFTPCKVLAGFVLCAACAVAQIPSVADGGVLNAASFTKGQAVAPGSLVSIFGSDLAASLAQADTVPLSTTLADVSVTFNGISAPLQFVAPGQINAQLPYESLPAGVPNGQVNVVVMRSGANSLPKSVSLLPITPGVYTIPPGVGYAVAVNNADGTIAAPVGAIQGFPTHPARVGDVLIVYANGLGPVDPPVANGAASLDKLRNTLTMPTVWIGGVQAQVLFSGLSPQFPGVNQLNVVIPNVAAGDKIPFQVESGGIRSTDQAVIAITN
jgi:uncharacterized protein (TIGR03437 family)